MDFVLLVHFILVCCGFCVACSFYFSLLWILCCLFILFKFVVDFVLLVHFILVRWGFLWGQEEEFPRVDQLGGNALTTQKNLIIEFATRYLYGLCKSFDHDLKSCTIYNFLE